MREGRIQPGDRVRTRVATSGVAVGAPGTVRLQFTTAGDLYEVRFDGRLWPHLLRRHKLEVDGEVSAAEMR